MYIIHSCLQLSLTGNFPCCQGRYYGEVPLYLDEYTCLNLSEFAEMWPLSFGLALVAARLQASAVFNNVAQGLP